MEDPDDVSDLRFVAGITKQAAAFAWLPGTDPVQFLIVTSRRTQRWVFPKGGIDEGMTEPETAAQEAFEEAGIHGEVAPVPIGHYRVPKIRPPLIWTLEVALYPLRIDKIDDDWLESHQRERRFVSRDEAAGLLDDPELVALADRFLSSL